MKLDTHWLGRIDYLEALAHQEALADQRYQEEIGDTLLLLEHEPVYTIGRTGDRSSLGPDGKPLPHPVVSISRGGQATYHGPGQLVAYAIIDLRKYGQDLHAYLRALEGSLIDLAAHFGIHAQRRAGLTGVWVETRKLASIGVGVRRWITLHGLALNVESDLTGFDAIIPCGLHDVTMTSLASEMKTSDTPDTAAVAAAFPPFLEARLQELSVNASLPPDETQ